MTALNPGAPRYLEQLAARAGEIIRAAEADGLSIDDGNVVDLIADNTDAKLDEIRVALRWLYPRGERFVGAVERRRCLHVFEFGSNACRKCGSSLDELKKVVASDWYEIGRADAVAGRAYSPPEQYSARMRYQAGFNGDAALRA